MRSPDPFAADLGRLLRRRWLLVGVGNPLCGDDAFGPLLARRLRSLGLPALDAGNSPESFTGPILAAAPDHLIVADAADMEEEIGTVRLLSPSLARAGGVSTHDPALALLLSHLRARRTMTAAILAVQGGSTDLGRPVGPEVRATLDRLLELFQGLCCGSRRGATDRKVHPDSLERSSSWDRFSVRSLLTQIL